MPEPEHLRPATPDAIMEALFFALRYEGRRRVHHADSVMARITAERLVDHLAQSGFVVMKKPPVGAHGMPGKGSLASLTPFRLDPVQTIYGSC